MGGAFIYHVQPITAVGALRQDRCIGDHQEISISIMYDIASTVRQC